MNYDNAKKIIEKNLLSIFGNRLKKFYIENFNPNQIDNIYDKNNICHNTFMNNKYSNFTRKKALMCQFYKLYKCYNLLCDYEKENNIDIDIDEMEQHQQFNNLHFHKNFLRKIHSGNLV